MDHIVLSSSTDGDDEATPLLDKEAEKQLEGELDMAEKLMNELQGDDGEKKVKKRGGKSAADTKKLKLKNGGIKKAAKKKEPAQKKQKKDAKKEKDSPAKMKPPKIKSSGDEDDLLLTESDSDLPSSDDADVPKPSARLQAKNRKKAEKMSKDAGWFSDF